MVKVPSGADLVNPMPDIGLAPAGGGPSGRAVTIIETPGRPDASTMRPEMVPPRAIERRTSDSPLSPTVTVVRAGA